MLGPDHSALIRYTRKGEFQINLVLPEVITFQDENQKDLLQRQITILNSYTGKSQIHLQATELKRVLSQRVRISYFRQICTNGLMAWADEFFTLDEYFDFLATGEKSADRRWNSNRQLDQYTQGQTSFEEYEEKEMTNLLRKSFSHRGLEENFFYEFLCEFLTSVVNMSKDQESLTLSVFDAMSRKPVLDNETAQKILIDANLPRKLAKAAIERMEAEALQLETAPNAWLLYNGANHALFNQQSSIALDGRYSMDKIMFDAVNTAYLLN